MKPNTKRFEPVTITSQAPTPPTTSTPGQLLTPEQLAERLAVPVSWIRDRVRARARIRESDPIPVVRLGRYVRFRLADAEAWIIRQTDERAAK